MPGTASNGSIGFNPQYFFICIHFHIIKAENIREISKKVLTIAEW